MRGFKSPQPKYWIIAANGSMRKAYSDEELRLSVDFYMGMHIEIAVYERKPM